MPVIDHSSFIIQTWNKKEDCWEFYDDILIQEDPPYHELLKALQISMMALEELGKYGVSKFRIIKTESVVVFESN